MVSNRNLLFQGSIFSFREGNGIFIDIHPTSYLQNRQNFQIFFEDRVELLGAVPHEDVRKAGFFPEKTDGSFPAGRFSLGK